MSAVSAVKNPLTIIAIFAGIAEISGTGVLPFVAPENQRLYIWFLIAFPIVLILCFFVTLNFNHGVLYAPSDWKDEDNFFRRFSRASSDEQRAKAAEEVAEFEADPQAEFGSNGVSGQGNKVEPDQDGKVENASSYRKLSASSRMRPLNVISAGREIDFTSLRIIERIGLAGIEGKVGFTFDRDMRFKSKTGPSVVFDGLAYQGDIVHVAEVKFVAGPGSARFQIEKMIPRLQVLAAEFREGGKIFVPHLAFVFRSVDDRDVVNRIISEITKRVAEYSLNIHLYWFDVDGNSVE